MQVVIGAMGIETSGFFGDLPLIIAFVIPAGVYLQFRPARAGDDRGGQGHADLHHRVRRHHRRTGSHGRLRTHVRGDPESETAAARRLRPDTWGTFSAYATLALGLGLCVVPLSALDHRHLELLQRPGRAAQRGHAASLLADARSFGAGRLHGDRHRCRRTMPQFAPGFKAYSNNFAVPALFMAMFPDWFVGVAFAAIAIGALVPAAIMSIATANTYTRNIYREFINPNCTDLARKAGWPRSFRLVIKVGALVLIFFVLAAICPVAAASGWSVDHSDGAVRDHRPMYTRFFQRLGVVLRLAGGFRHRHLDGAAQQLRSRISLKILGIDVALATSCWRCWC